MGKIRKIFFWLTLFFVLIFIAGSIGIGLFGKRIVEAELEKSLRMPVRLRKISLTLPLRIELTELELGYLASIEKISASPSIFSLFSGRIVFSDLTLKKPVVYLQRQPDGSLNLPEFKNSGERRQIPFYSRGVTVIDGRLLYADKRIKPAGFNLIIDKINLSFSKVMLPLTSLNTRFKASAVFLDASLASLIGSADFSGWIDFGSKDMEATLGLKDLNLVYFSPYYGNFISKRKLLAAKLNLQSQLYAKNNDLTVSSHFKLSDLVYALQEPQAEGIMKSFDLTKDTLDFFRDKQGNLVLDFTLNTRLDKPQVSSAQLKKVILEAALKNLASQSPEDLAEKLSETLEKLKAIGKEWKDIFR